MKNHNPEIALIFVLLTIVGIGFRVVANRFERAEAHLREHENRIAALEHARAQAVVNALPAPPPQSPIVFP